MSSGNRPLNMTMRIGHASGFCVSALAWQAHSLIRNVYAAATEAQTNKRKARIQASHRRVEAPIERVHWHTSGSDDQRRSTVYLTALEQLAFKVSLNQITAPLLNLSVYAKRIPLTSEAVDNLDNLVTSIATEHIEDLYAGHEMYLRGTSSIVGTEERPLPDVLDAESIPEEEARPIVWTGSSTTLTNMEHHADFLEGRAASDVPIEVGETITVEATISEQVADESGLGPGDTVEVAIDVFVPTRINVRIVGIFQADDLKDE